MILGKYIKKTNETLKDFYIKFSVKKILFFFYGKEKFRINYLMYVKSKNI